MEEEDGGGDVCMEERTDANADGRSHSICYYTDQLHRYAKEKMGPASQTRRNDDATAIRA